MALTALAPARAADVVWDFEEGNDHGFFLWSVSPAPPAPDDPTTAGDEALTGDALPGAGITWTIGPPNQFDGQKPAVTEGCHVVGGVLEYGPCNDPFGAAGGNITNDRGQQDYLNTYNLSQWGDNLHTEANDQIGTSPQVRLGDGAVLTVWAHGGGNGTHAPELDPNPDEGYTTDSAGIAVRSAADNSLLESVLTNGHGTLREDTIDLSAYAGQKVYIEVVDAFQGSWGWIAVDEIRITNSVDLGSTPALASNPEPGDEVTDVPRDVVFGWDPGDFASTHDVYFGAVFDDVNTASRANPMGVLASQGQAATTFDPEGVLALGQTYYWRIDEVNAAPDNTIFKGKVWSFTVEPLAYPVANISATASGFDAGCGPENTVNGSGLDESDQHSIDAPDMWLTTGGGDPVWIQYEFDQVYKLHELWVWNYNVMFELVLGFGVKDVTIEYSTDGDAWTSFGDVEFAKATAMATYTHNTTVDLGGIAAKCVRLAVNSGWGMLGQFGLSEVRFWQIPAHPREPQPADGATDVAVDTMLDWRGGREAVTHDIHFGTDAEALALVDTVAVSEYDPGILDLGTAYYWQIAEVNEAEAISAWQGALWSFSTQDYLVVDDFESYNDDDNRIYETWLDGFVNDTGSTVGHFEAPFAEQEIVRSGRQSMPLFYDNTGAATSEAEFALGQDWTGGGIQSLSLYFHGDAANSGQLYMKIDDTKIPYDGAATDIARAAWLPWNVDLAASGANLSNVDQLIIGIEGAGATGVVYIDDIRLYPLAAERIVPAEPDTANLVAHYALNGDVADASGNGHNGVANGGPTYAGGIEGQAIGLDGAGDHVVIASVGIAEGAPRTVSGWAKADRADVGAWTDVFGFTGPSGDGGHFDIECVGNTSTTTLGYYGIHRYGWEQDIMPIDLEWHYLAATFDGETVAWYGDGLLMGTDAVAAADVVPPGQVHIGKREDNTNFFPGLVDEVRIYDRALSPAEVAGLAGLTEPIHKPF
jgi:hypothetical protein